MLDFDLAKLYEVETRILNQAVKRNIDVFPQDFMFQLSQEEWTANSSQIVMSSRKNRGMSYLPYAFREPQKSDIEANKKLKTLHT